jgi:hypothetical protein
MSGSSGVWLGKGGWFKVSETNKTEVVCTFVLEDGSVCGRTMALHNSNMWKHLRDMHDFNMDDARRRAAEQQKGGMRSFTVSLRRPPLSSEQQSEYSTLLSVALANQGLSLFTFNKRPDKHMAVIEESGESAFETFERFTLHDWLVHVFPEFKTLTAPRSVAHGPSCDQRPI